MGMMREADYLNKTFGTYIFILSIEWRTGKKLKNKKTEKNRFYIQINYVFLFFFFTTLYVAVVVFE